jgi:hypothetical protein
MKTQKATDQVIQKDNKQCNCTASELKQDKDETATTDFEEVVIGPQTKDKDEKKDDGECMI